MEYKTKKNNKNSKNISKKIITKTNTSNTIKSRLEYVSNKELFENSHNLILEYSKQLDSKSTTKQTISIDYEKIFFEKYDVLMKEIDRRNLYEHSLDFLEDSSFRYYPDLNNRDFNNILYSKKEFYIHKQEKLKQSNIDSREGISKKICDPLFDSITGKPITDKSKIMFNLTNSQKYLKTFMSPETPYRSLLLYHGTGVGKTCTSISIAEQFSDQLKRDGKKICILLNQSIKDNFIKNIFNIQKLKSGMPNYQCTGNDYLKYIPDYKNMELEDIQKRILKIIKNKYSFYGYQKFANIINNLEDKIKKNFSNDIADTRFKKKIKEMFSKTVMIIDEAHNIKEGEGAKVLPPILDKVVSIADNMRLLLLSATPMFDNATEIVWLINLLLKNEKRLAMKVSDYFDSDGAIIPEQITSFKEKTRGLVSYVRGENPYRFPDRLYPSGKNIILPKQMPKYSWDGELIPENHKIKELVLVDCKMKGFQQGIYKQMLTSDKVFGSFKQPGLMCSNIVFPSKEDIGDVSKHKSGSIPMNSSPNNNNNNNKNNNNSIGQTGNRANRFSINKYIGDRGFNNVAEKTKVNDRVVYKINNNIFTKDNIEQYSSKIHRMIEFINNSKDEIVFIYSQFINSGVIPIALALEYAGYSKYGGSLLEKEARPNRGKYIIISGMNDISKNAYKNYLKIENDNKDGKKVKIIIGSETASEGLDFRYIRSVHILEPWFHLNKLDQIIGRAIRNCSHIDLSPDKRNVKVYFYTANSSDKEDKDNESLDISIYREAEQKTRNISEVEYILKTNAMDCGVNKHNNLFFNDKDYSRKCNFKKCDYKCEGIPTLDIGDKDINYDSVNFKVMKDVTDDVVKIIKYGNNISQPLFSTKFIFSLNEIIEYMNTDILAILLGLHKVIITRDTIFDKFGREAYLEYKNGEYIVVPQKMSNTLFTSNDIKTLQYKKTKKIGISDNIIKYISEGNIISSDQNSSTSEGSHSKINYKKSDNIKTKKITKIKKIKSGNINILKNYSESFKSIKYDIDEFSKIDFLNTIIQENSNKFIYDPDELRKMFTDIVNYWIIYLDPDRKKILCEMLIYKHYKQIISPSENITMNELYNIITYNDIYFNDISFKGDLNKIWGYKLGNYKKQMEYFRYDENKDQFIPGTDDEIKSINKSFIKKNSGNTLIFNNLIGFIDLKMPQQNMLFKIRDKRSEGNKGTQIKTGSVCNNDGMKKNKIIEYLRVLLDDTSIYNDVGKKALPSKNILCIQLELYLRYFDKTDKTRYFFNYEEMIEYKLTQKKN